MADDASFIHVFSREFFFYYVLNKSVLVGLA